MTAIPAEYVNFKNVMSRKVLQIILEVPAEQTQEALSKLGVPSAHESTWVGVALIHEPEPQSILDAMETIRMCGEVK